jgi:ATP-dependent Clp protease adaptor protein ClpS
MADIITEQSTDTTVDINLFNPGKFKVIVCNDDQTPMDFVIAMLMHVFHHDEAKAKQITMQIHHEGSGIAGIYSHEVAEQKGIEGTLLARQNGWPLAIKIEEE